MQPPTPRRTGVRWSGRLTGAPSGDLAEAWLTEQLSAQSLVVTTQEVSLPVYDLSSPIDLSVVSGDDQFGQPGEELPNPLVVMAVDQRGRPARGQIVNFRVVPGDSSGAVIARQVSTTSSAR